MAANNDHDTARRKLLVYYLNEGMTEAAVPICQKSLEKGDQGTVDIINKHLLEKEDIVLFTELEKHTTLEVRKKYCQLISQYFSLSKLEKKELKRIQKRWKDQECLVCYYVRKNITLPCSHRVCVECAPKLDKCPVCRQA